MNGLSDILRRDEKAVFCLRGLYERYGYKKYKMSKFEHYDLYLENKSFLTSEKIITFTDPGGKLMALKPDITLSIIKNAPETSEGTYKVYYCENVYRAGAGSEEIKEIMQVGIELIGRVDLYSEAEVLMLAAKSLEEISQGSVIGVSHMGLVSGLLDEAGLDASGREKASECIAGRNVHTLRELCRAEKVGTDASEALILLTGLYGDFKTVLPELNRLKLNDKCSDAVRELEALFGVLSHMGESGRFAVDFSVTNDMNYYNGITFQGFIDGVPRHVLSGGRYDALVHKMGRDCGAIGFAVYPDLLERLAPVEKDSDVDLLIVYGEDCSPSQVAAAVKAAQDSGKKACAVSAVTQTTPTYKEKLVLGGAK